MVDFVFCSIVFAVDMDHNYEKRQFLAAMLLNEQYQTSPVYLFYNIYSIQKLFINVFFNRQSIESEYSSINIFLLFSINPLK